ncbi:DDB1- and CUL4-associated factor 11 [Copidosoma floridanum]|uniref:DDB1- and CUL4-associated factor 11 n=1 Tax=Copidosoma floridanum TaxID=29053 RepID=UPI0006C94A1F|nr:DDB1- and CUL4-associated factor 11 [Copidosoma floridanum]
MRIDLRRSFGYFFDFAQIQFLLYNLVNRIIIMFSGYINDDDEDDSQEDYVQPTVSPKNSTLRESTEKLDKSDLSLSIKQACSLNNTSKLSLAVKIRNRELGPSFTSGEKARIACTYLPNHDTLVTKYNKKPFCGTFSQDGKYLLTTTHDRVIHLYEHHKSDYKEYKKFFVSSVGWSILDTAFSPDGNYFVYSSWSDYLYLHSVHGDPKNRESLLLNADNQMFCVFSVVFSSDGRELFCGGNDGCLYIYDRGSQQCTKVEGHGYDINSVAFADDSSQILYSAGDDSLCKVWDRRSLREDDPKPVGTLVGHMGGITYVDPRRDGRHLITNSKDQTIKLWDARVFSSSKVQEQAESSVSIAWDYRWQHVPKKFLCPRKPLEGDTSLMTYRGHIVVQTLIRCHFSPAATTGQRYIYTGCGTGCVIIYDLLTGEIVRTLKGHNTVVRDVSWHPYHQEIVSTSWDCSVKNWTYRTDEYKEDENSPLKRNSDNDDQTRRESPTLLRTRNQTSALRRSRRTISRQSSIRNFS